MATVDPEIWSPGTGPRPSDKLPPLPWHRRLVAACRTLKVRLTLAAIGSLVVGIGVISMLSLSQVEHDVLAQTQARELAQTSHLAGDLSQRVIALQQALRLTAEQIDPLLESQDEAIEQHLLHQPTLLQQFSNLFVVAVDGTVRVSIDQAGSRRPHISIADRDYFQQVLANKRPGLSRALASRMTGEPVIVFVHPLVRDGQVTSVVGATIRLSSRSLAASLLDWDFDPGSTELLAICDELGIAIAHPKRDMLLKKLTLESRLSDAMKDWASRGSPAEPSGLVLRQSGEIVTAAGVAGTDWVVWRAIPQETLLEPLHQARWQALRNAGAVITALGLMAFWLVKRLLAPLVQLEERARTLFDKHQDIHEGWPKDLGEVGSLVQVLRHVGAERAQLESFNGQLLGKLHSVMAAAPLGISFTRNQRFELVSRSWCRMLQREEAELLGGRASDAFASEGEYEQLGPQAAEAFERQGEYAGEWRFRRKDGSIFWGQLSGRPVDPFNDAAGTIWMLADVTAARTSRENLEWSATHDPLTGLANRLAFESHLRSLLGHPPAALIIIDLDRFKPINDTHGHTAGDALLKQVASALTSHVRSGDLVVRVGGDEFAVVLEHCPPDAAQRVAQEVQRAVTRVQLPWEGHILAVGASVGVASLSDKFNDIDQWIIAADSACYAAKAAGRDTCRADAAASSNVFEFPSQFQGG